MAPKYFCGLNPRLEEKVSELNPGDGIVVEYEISQGTGRAIGYVAELTESFLTLTSTRNPGFISQLRKLVGKLNPLYYSSVESVRVVDPVKKK